MGEWRLGGSESDEQGICPGICAEELRRGCEYMKIGHIERDYRMTLKEQLESIAEDYEGFQYICVSCRKITFMYEKERECA